MFSSVSIVLSLKMIQKHGLLIKVDECFRATHRQLPKFGETGNHFSSKDDLVRSDWAVRSLKIKMKKTNKQTKTIPVKINYIQLVSGNHTWESKLAIMCKSPTNNSLASSDSSMWSKEEKTKSCSILCQEFVSVFCQKLSSFQWAIPV